MVILDDFHEITFSSNGFPIEKGAKDCVISRSSFLRSTVVEKIFIGEGGAGLREGELSFPFALRTNLHRAAPHKITTLVLRDVLGL